MLDFSRIKTPPHHADTLVVPDARALAPAARANAAALRAAERPLLDSTLNEWRRRTREQVVGTDDAPVIVIGHQPAFIHPGVWAKHIVAARLAAATDGRAVNLVVDSDAPRTTTVAIPVVDDASLTLRQLPFASSPPGFAYEQISTRSAEALAAFEDATRQAMGARWQDSQLPTFHRAQRDAQNPADWVDQAIAARQAVEGAFGLRLIERRASRHWCSPLLLDMLLHAERFSDRYNRALADYRRTQRMRGTRHPMPDLQRGEDRWELPVWLYRPDGPRRRLFVARHGDTLRLYADQTAVGELSASDCGSCDALAGFSAGFDAWRFRPRALTLTIWARLLLADLFIHGIGGAKYDRIADRIIADYYGIEPPSIACVSATLLLDLPRMGITEDTIRDMRHRLRDLRFNPQRHLPIDRIPTTLLERRAGAVGRSTEFRRTQPRNRTARRAAFVDIRRVNAEILEAHSETQAAQLRTLDAALAHQATERIAASREYFFGLYDSHQLERLLGALPQTNDFRV